MPAEKPLIDWQIQRLRVRHSSESNQNGFFFRFFVESPLEKTVFPNNIIKAVLYIVCTAIEVNRTVFFEKT